MNWRNVRLIASREVQDQLRDRRTLFMVLVLPLLLYPGLAIGMLQMQSIFVERERTVVVLGTDHLPDEAGYALVDGDRFVKEWFTSPLNVEKLRVVSDAPREEGAEEPTAEAIQRRAKLLAVAREVRTRVERRREILRELGRDPNVPNLPSTTESTSKDAATVQSEEELALLHAELGRLFAESEIQVLIVVPEGFDDHLAAVNQRLEDREALPEGAAADAIPRPLIIRNGADEKSRIAHGRVKEAIDAWKAHIVQDRLKRADLPTSITDVDTETVEVAGNEEFTANIWGKLFPALLVIMCVTGAFHPAVDLAAGEKERGTMETLLICPASRTEIVIGKFLTIMLFSVTTAMLNLVSMGITAAYIVSMKADAGPSSAFANLGFPGTEAIVWVVVLSIPLAALFSALCLALSTFARSVKEGQYYLTPLLMVTLGLTVFCMSPGAEIDAFNSVLPVVGPALLLKGLLVSSGAYLYVVPVLVTSCGYSAIALWWAIEQFRSEDVLFREAERFELRLWWRHLLRDKEPTPSSSEAVFCLVLVFLLQFATIGAFSRYAGQPASPGYSDRTVQLLLIQQLLFFATPALLMSVMLTSNPLRTLRIRIPSLRYLAAAVVLAVALRPVAIETLQWMETWFFHDLPPAVMEQLKLATDARLSVGMALLVFAVVPGVCEEIAFRGFLLSGFDRPGRTWVAIALSSIAFGVVHMIPQMVFHAAVLGAVIGLLAVRSGSLFVCMAFHITSNAVTVLNARIAKGDVHVPGYDWIVSRSGEAIHFHPVVLAASAIVSGWLLWWLIVTPSEGAKVPAVADDSTPGTDTEGVDEVSAERRPASV